MDLQAFIGAALAPRQRVVDVPELAAWYAADAAPRWTVRGLTAAELARCNQAAEHGLEKARELVAALAGSGSAKADAVTALLGLGGDDVPPDISRRIEMLAQGSVQPALGPDQRDVAVKLAESFPTTFFALTNAILALTGQGAEPGKQTRSGQTPA